jgi:hypothetical protein
MDANIETQRDLCNGFLIGSIWDFECYDKNGKLKWEERNRPNMVTHEGIDFILDVMFHGTTACGTWYIFPVESDTTALATFTYHAIDSQFTECTAYDEATRVEFNEAAASGQAITNSANKASFTMNDTKTLYGGALVTTSTKSDHESSASKVLFCYSKFDAGKTVESGDIFKIKVTITGTHA